MNFDFFTRHSGAKWSAIFTILFSFWFIPAHFLNKDIASYDDRSYLSHAFTIGYDFDLDYTNEIALRFNKDGNMPSHPIGSGLLAAPFVSLFGIVDRLSGHAILTRRSEYFSAWGYFGFLFSVNFYFLIGVILYYRSILYVYPRATLLLTLMLVFSTGIPYYVLGRFTMAHGFEFFTFATTLYFSTALYRSVKDISNKCPYLCLAAVGLFSTSILWVRPSNIVGLFIPFLVLLTLSALDRNSIKIRQYLLVAVSIIVFLIPYFLFSLEYYHSIIPSHSESYNGAMFGKGLPNSVVDIILYVASLTPNIYLILFSSEFGILYTNPVLIIGVIGVIWFAISTGNRQTRSPKFIILFSFLIYYAYNFAIVLVWKTTASDYGYRYLYSLVPLGIFYTSVLLRCTITNKYSSHRTILNIIILFCVIGITNAFFYKTTSSLAPKEQVNVYGEWHSSSVKGYEKHLVTELQRYETYLAAIGKTYFGLWAMPYVMETDLINLLSQEQKAKYLPRYKGIRLVVYIQTLVLLMLWLVFGYYTAQYKPRKP